MFCNIHSSGILGIEGYPIQVEVDVSDGLPSFSMVGYLSSEVKEAQDRVRTAIRNSGFRLPPSKITVNLSPADVRKEGTACDLPVAVGILASIGSVQPELLKDSLIAGELGLDGRIKKIHGALPMAVMAQKEGLKRCFLPKPNAREGTLVPGMTVVGVTDLKQLVRFLNEPHKIEPELAREDTGTEIGEGLDFKDVQGQVILKRATEVAVAGMHNILYIGMAGSGKSMIAQRIPSIMPELSMEESLNITQIYSVRGLLPEDTPLVRRRPFRSPHHTITVQALTGGGRIPKPGEISLASGGVLFLDEMPEFQRQVLESLRQPLEDRVVRISRLHGSCCFPADCMLAASMNPCYCGFYPDRSKCSCTERQVQTYLGRISRPLLDRMDLCVDAAPVSFEELHQTGESEASAQIRVRVEQAVEIQRKRFAGQSARFNSRMNRSAIREHCALLPEDEDFLKQVYQMRNFSARCHDKILKTARTIADLDGRKRIERSHLGEAMAYRSLDVRYWT